MQHLPLWLLTGLVASALQVWARRQISSSGQDPLDHVFLEFDSDNDGYLNAEDVTAALSSRNVNITPEQAQVFLEGRWALGAIRQVSQVQCMQVS